MAIVNTGLTLKDLPTPPEGKTGWPWTEQTEPLPDKMPDGSEWPRISIVTPSYNQGQFIEETIRSVLLQGYPNLEYIIIDGGSTDNTVEIINKYETYIAYWVSESDKGQTDAINKGFAKATGNLVGWQNSDDFYYANAFNYAVKSANIYPDYDVFYGTRDYLNLDGNGVLTEDNNKSSFNLEKMIPNANMANQSLFFRSRIFQDGNFLDTSFHHCMDHEFFWRLIFKGYRFIFIPKIKGCYRLHPDCKGRQQNNDYLVDTIRICQMIYKNNELPYMVRRQAWLFLRGNCLDNYGKLKLEIFRKYLYNLIYLGGITSLDMELIVKYIVSFLGMKRLNEMRKIKFILK
ncbi:MAG: glycosyltransferase family 2 protein [Nostoc sp.]